MGVLVLGACAGRAEVPIPTLPPLDLSLAPAPTSILAPVATVPSSTTTVTTTSVAELPIVDLLLAEPYGGSGCLGSETMLTNTGGVSRFVWLLDPATLEASTIDVRLLRTDSLVYVLDGSTVIVSGRDGLVLVEGTARTVLFSPPESDDAVFEPTVWTLDVWCSDGVVTVAVAGVLDDLVPVTWAIVTLDVARTLDEVSFDPGVFADFGLFSPDGAYLLVGAYGPDPAFGGLHRVIDVAEGSVFDIDVDFLEPTEQSLLTRIGWVDNETLYVERRTQENESSAVILALPGATVEVVEVGSEALVPISSCAIAVASGFVTDADGEALATISRSVFSVCW